MKSVMLAVMSRPSSSGTDRNWKAICVEGVLRLEIAGDEPSPVHVVYRGRGVALFGPVNPDAYRRISVAAGDLTILDLHSSDVRRRKLGDHLGHRRPDGQRRLLSRCPLNDCAGR
ncbi:hypothetical protein OK015_02285 [Mycobacterium sp. Aquia_216]|uniref:hypothetical protein n=1 Tax=Mycobacterium sp. Aquia_216 TaxID=2991729 RepID=UPI00227C86BF|nr:hypothetical protein [Mycobacterium sp. Aquia_216]WAJ47940.1 hypothetical protein OK015_02285 [Mycobacterium sp. Aquia_216]